MQEENIKVPRFEEAQGFYTTPARSKQMSRIRFKNSKPEMVLRRALWNMGIRFRIHSKDLPGHPDVVIHKYRIAVFVDGEFWHGYQWEQRKGNIKTNRGFWLPKIERNMQRDRQVNEKLQKLGYTVIRFWGNQVKTELGVCIMDILKELETRYWYGNPAKR